jgi:hypothetical protein
MPMIMSENDRYWVLGGHGTAKMESEARTKADVSFEEPKGHATRAR